MATTVYTKAPNPNQTQASFIDVWSAFSAALTTVGFLKTTDTGQVDWASNPAHPATTTFPYYEIRKFSDALQATAPLFMKIEYGMTANTNIIRFQLGTATDGAGNLTKQLSAVFTLSGSATTTTGQCYVSYGDGRVSWTLWPTVASAAQTVSVARTVNDDGSPNGDGFNVVTGSNAKQQQFVPSEGGGAPFPITPLTNYVCSAPGTGTGNAGTIVSVYPVFPFRGYNDNPIWVRSSWLKQTSPSAQSSPSTCMASRAPSSSPAT
jgi:hypothetical protein